MPVEERFVIRFAAEPPQELLPYGRWAESLSNHFLSACEARDPEEGDDLGEAGDVVFYPDRTFGGRTYVPCTCTTSTDFEFYGYVSYVPATEGQDSSDFQATADYTDETAEQNPEWRIDLCDEIIGTWRGEEGNTADMTLIWGRPMVVGGVVITAELADLVVDQCTLINERFTLIAPDNYRQDTLDCKLYDKRGGQIAVESLYADDDDDDEESDDE